VLCGLIVALQGAHYHQITCTVAYTAETLYLFALEMQKGTKSDGLYKKGYILAHSNLGMGIVQGVKCSLLRSY